jgi:hypothetical protein
LAFPGDTIRAVSKSGRQFPMPAPESEFKVCLGGATAGAHDDALTVGPWHCPPERRVRAGAEPCGLPGPRFRTPPA